MAGQIEISHICKSIKSNILKFPLRFWWVLPVNHGEFVAVNLTTAQDTQEEH